ncbi:MAG TPA: universal stress protein [Corynebacteriales bacterium]|nr:universal stress protein [Mycobacteriales bacterium]
MSDNKIGIVVGVDGSPSSDLATRWAAREATARNLPLLLAAAYVIPQFLYAEGMIPSKAIFNELEQDTQESIDQAAAIAQEINPDLEILQEIREGSPINMLLELSEEADMVVVGSRGLGGIAGALLGSVSTSVIGHAKCPVVVLREDDMYTDPEDGPVVVGVDGSKISELALEEAFKAAEAYGTGVIAVNAWLDRAVQSTLAGVNLSSREWQRAQEEQEKMLEESLAPVKAAYPNVKVKLVVHRESPEVSLAEEACKARLLVVGSHGRGGFAGMLLGSTSRALLRLAPCPLMVVRGERE